MQKLIIQSNRTQGTYSLRAKGQEPETVYANEIIEIIIISYYGRACVRCGSMMCFCHLIYSPNLLQVRIMV